jgi:hypothetical protein
MAQRPDNWKLGLFYYNKEDKRIFPQKEWLGLDGLSIIKSYFSSRISNCINHYNQISFFPQKIIIL